MRSIEADDPTSFQAHSALVRRLRLSDAEASDLLQELAIDAIRRSPGVYLWGTWLKLGVLVSSQSETVALHVEGRRQSWKGTELLDLVKNGTIPELIPPTWDASSHLAIAEAVAGIYQPAHWNGLLLTLAIIATAWGLWDSERRMVLLPVGVVIAIMLCTALVVGAIPRYRYPMDPLLHVAASSSLVWIVVALRSRISRQRAELQTQPT